MPTTVDQLRHDIDTGRTRDKVRHGDPAAAPLGTDEEAAGTPLQVNDIETARRQEISGPPKTNQDGGLIFYAGVLAIILVVISVGVLAFVP